MAGVAPKPTHARKREIGWGYVLIGAGNLGGADGARWLKGDAEVGEIKEVHDGPVHISDCPPGSRLHSLRRKESGKEGAGSPGPGDVPAQRADGS